MKLIDRIRKETPLKDELKGQFCTKIGAVCGSLLAMAYAGTVVFPPAGLVALTIGSIVFGCKAVYHAQKVEK